MHNQISLRSIFGLITSIAIIITCFRSFEPQAIVASLLAMLVMVLVAFALYAVLFLLVFPFARLNQYFDNQSDQGQSPFAEDRLPTQIVAPTNRGVE